MSSTTPSTTPPAPTAPTGPSVHRRAFITWLAVYPTITLVIALLGPAMEDLPLVLRTMILTVVVIPIAAYVLIPALMKANAALGSAGRR
ncbi:hypothetical protein [Streptomyces sp. NPDC002990]